MASAAPQAISVNADTLITVKVATDGSNRRFKLALRDLGAHVFPQKLRFLLAIPPDATVVFERYSDSAAAFVRLDSENTGVYKQLYRAAKAKLKLRIKATVTRRTLESQSTTSTETLKAESTPLGLPPGLPPFMYSSNLTPSQPPLAPAAVVAPTASATTLVNTQPERSNDQMPAMKFELPPVPGCFPTLNEVFPKLEPVSSNLPARPFPGAAGLTKPFPRCFPKPSICHNDFPVGSFCIDCNNCNKSIPDVHYHCSICDDGDFDLCQPCVDSGVLCGVEGHWLIKRFIQDGKVINSTTETIEPRKTVKSEPQAADNEKSALVEVEPKVESFSRTCNACVGVFDDSAFVSCEDCEDYDLCVSCHLRLEHGHHPGHTFKPLSQDTSFGELVLEICQAGRGMHHHAICDGCDKHIVGVRHKCLTCPDWDYCSSCIQSAKHIHPGHRFAPIYEPISDAPPKTKVHYGIYCDGPLCKNKDDRCYIVGDRYKCAVCHDTDFCANCEAVPVNRHNRTHPMIKFRTPVRNVSVTTLGEKGNGERMIQMGDRPPMTKSAATETTPATTSANAATQVHTVVEVKPFDEPVVEDAKENAQAATITPVADLQAYFIRDSVPDSSQVVADTKFDQVWTLRNPGPLAWPAGCSVRFIGGDAMLNVDSTRPSSVSAIADATESNVIGREVQPGETIDFCVTLKAPEREGKAISYWRLKAADGTPFGHKLWCDIDVVKPRSVSPAKAAEEVEKVEQEKVSETVKDVEEIRESTMIFPKLDKESPMSSTHEASTGPTITDNTSTAEQELLEDVESLELEEEETDDGFLTDEEYDILDASDEEYLAEAQQPGKK